VPTHARRSNEEWHSRALEGAGLYRLLDDRYPAMNRPGIGRDSGGWIYAA
jgi:hypothetical protein